MWMSRPLRPLAISLLAVLPALAVGVLRGSKRGQLDVASASSGANHGSSELAEGDKGPGPRWFGDFSASESTYDVSGIDPVAGRVVKYGKDPYNFPEIFDGLKKEPAAWYTESESAGPADAWQTFFPEQRSRFNSASAKFKQPWRGTPEGYVQDYNYPENSGGDRKKAPWFDASVSQYDGFGRHMQPVPGDPRRCLLLDGWQERAVNTTIACADPGCEAQVSLNVFDPATEEVCSCKLSVGVHATDFLNTHSLEIVEFLNVNDKGLGSCKPDSQGCNATAWAPLYPCFNDFDVTAIAQASAGVFSLVGKISQAVDECPYDGNLFSGVVTATCLVRTMSTDTVVPGPQSGTEEGGNNLSVQEQEEELNKALDDIFGAAPLPVNDKMCDSDCECRNTANGTTCACTCNATDIAEGVCLAGGSCECSWSGLADEDPVITRPCAAGPNAGIVGGTSGSTGTAGAPTGTAGAPTGTAGAPTGTAAGALADVLKSLAGLSDDGAGDSDATASPTSTAASPGAAAAAAMLLDLEAALVDPLPGTKAALNPGDVVAGTGSVPLQCQEINCTATLSLGVNPLMSFMLAKGATCSLSVAFNQTDFDGNEGTLEQIDFVTVGSETAATALPSSAGVAGLNPCQAAYNGVPVAADQLAFTGIVDYDVTALVAVQETLDVSAKISEFVDMCASQEVNLLDALARIDCFPPAR